MGVVGVVVWVFVWVLVKAIGLRVSADGFDQYFLSPMRATDVCKVDTRADVYIYTPSSEQQRFLHAQGSRSVVTPFMPGVSNQPLS